MVKAIRVHEVGGPDAMRWEEVHVGEPKDGEIRVKNTAVGVNFIDVYFRKGVYSAPLPFTPGTAEQRRLKKKLHCSTEVLN
jgi:NADPH2:quinone reductase